MSVMTFSRVRFLVSVHHLGQLPESSIPEIAFAGRSNVGKSSLINTLLGRKKLVKTSGRPGKTRGLNFFSVDEQFLLVDLPGYGFARVSKKEQASWQRLITEYFLQRTTLCLVVVIMDLRHCLKKMDLQLVDWLRHQSIPFLPVYTKADKLSKNKQLANAKALDAGLGISPDQRVIFSALTGQGREKLMERLAFARDSW